MSNDALVALPLNSGALEAACETRSFSRRIDLVFQANCQDWRYVAAPLQFRRMGDNEYVTEPTVSLTLDTAQQLMDELWRCGLRPSEGSGSAGALAATERHLKDMQRVAFTLLRDEQDVADQARERGLIAQQVLP